MQDKELDALLGLAAARPPAASDRLMDRVLADALAAQPRPAAIAKPAPSPRGGVLARLAAMFGGGPVLAGVCSAAIAGIALGYLNPASVDMLTGGLGGAETLELFPSADFLTTEG